MEKLRDFKRPEFLIRRMETELSNQLEIPTGIIPTKIEKFDWEEGNEYYLGFQLGWKHFTYDFDEIRKRNTTIEWFVKNMIEETLREIRWAKVEFKNEQKKLSESSPQVVSYVIAYELEEKEHSNCFMGTWVEGQGFQTFHHLEFSEVFQQYVPLVYFDTYIHEEDEQIPTLFGTDNYKEFGEDIFRFIPHLTPLTPRDFYIQERLVLRKLEEKKFFP